MTTPNSGRRVGSTSDILRAAAEARRAAEDCGAHALCQHAIFETVVETMVALQQRFSVAHVALTHGEADRRPSILQIRMVGRSPRPPASTTTHATPSAWANHWREHVQLALNPQVIEASEDSVVLAIEPSLDGRIDVGPSRTPWTDGEVPGDDPTILDEVRHLNANLGLALVEAGRAREELSRLSRELDETNRGVVALYAELDERADELRRADHAKTRFLSNVSHELRTPLNSIRALAGLLLDRLDGPLTDEQLKQVTFIHTASGELRQTVDDLLDIAKIAAGKSEVQAAPFEMAELFGALRGTLKPLLVGNHVDLHFEAAAGLPPMISDERKIAQILRNLVSNALKYTEAGEVRVSAAVSADARTVCIEVTDTGIGIAPGDRERIFEEFVQIANPLQVKAKGTGLGLPLCRRLTTLLGGTIDVDGAPGKGSRFQVVLPRVFEANNDPKHADALPDLRRTETNPTSTCAPPTLRILLIDDDPAARYAVRRRLEDNGVSIVEADCGASGLDAVPKVAPDLVVLDLQLPDMHGIEVLRRLRGIPQAGTIPVAVLTSLQVDVGACNEFQAPFVTVMSKKEIGAADFSRRLLDMAAPPRGAPRP